MPSRESSQFNFPEREEKILKFWKENRTFERSLEKTKKGKSFVFYEGPPTANAAPGIHHVLARAFKDVMLRYKTMRGFFAPRRAGWDTHGLPVEIQVEKELGLATKQDIERYGIGPFNARARESVWRHKEEWEELTRRIAFWLDMDHPYITYDASYIEALWRIIKEFWKKKFLYEDFKVVPWCPRCETGLSTHELGQPGAYKTVKEQSIFVKLKIKDRKNEYFLIWTTTPWTLPANVAVAVNPRLEYTKYKHVMKKGRGERPGPASVIEYLWSSVTPPFDEGEELEVAEKVSGRSLVGLGYEPLFESPREHSLGRAPEFVTIAGEFVTAEEGTGMVHIAPAFGDEDMAVAKALWKESYPIFHTVNPDGTMKKGVIGEGKRVKDANQDIIADLERRGLLYKAVLHEHEYPHCWRCDAPLLYFARNAWWVKTTAVKEKLLLNNQKINWIPPHIKEGRFGEFLREVRDWAFSRERYWGTPLPIWKCGKCGAVEVVGSGEELEKRAGCLPKDEKGEVNFHRPYVDELVFECRACKGSMRRIPEVADVWFDSGAMPFASHAVVGTRELPVTSYQLLYPADYICEAVDQTRGWFYTLHAVGTLLGRGAAYRNVISLGHVLDKNGQKMSKSKGNVVNPREMIEKYGADTLRWYFFTVNAPGDAKRFDEKGLSGRLRGFIQTFWNCFALFDAYIKKIPGGSSAPPRAKHVLDRWIMTKLHALILETTKHFEAYDVTAASRAIEVFTINDFSQWYLRRSRRRFQHPQDAKEKETAGVITAYVLKTLAILAAPCVPMLAELIWQELRKKGAARGVSVHLESWPVSKFQFSVSRRDLIKDMDAARKIVAEGLRLRAEAGIKVRQPLQKFQISNLKFQKRAELLNLIKEEVNVKNVGFGEEIKLDTVLTVALKEEGLVREAIRAIQEMRKELGLKPAHKIFCRIAGARRVEEIISRRRDTLLRGANVKRLIFGGKKILGATREVTFEKEKLEIGIRR